MPERKTVVIVEDDFLIAEYLKLTCEQLGAEVLDLASKPDEGIEVIRAHSPDFVLMDVRLGGKRDGVDVAKMAYESHPETKIIFVTGSNEPPTIDRIKTDHPHRILIKPITPGALKDALES